ncbi:hypothetical protein IH981_03320 [Patescibacteria group bacterium]|nr:hypothetical protein [Patescibacteria group bacterium]
MVEKAAGKVILDWVSKALKKAEPGFAHELEWLASELRQMPLANNYHFFRRIAMRDDAASLWKWVISLGRSCENLSWIVKEARRVYSSGTPPFQPGLLKVLEGSEGSRFD